jgi:hypothetical protein
MPRETRVIATLPEELESEFRQIAMRKFGLKRGYLKTAFIEAIDSWIKTERVKTGKIKEVV